MPKVIRALIIQLLALVILAVGVYFLQFVVSPPYPIWVLVVAQGGISALLSCKMGLPCWWRWIQFLMPVALYVAVLLQVPSWLGLVAFIVLWLVFSNAGKERVPLYLTNNTTRQALKTLIKRTKDVRFLDLGCGLGGNVVFMSHLVNVTRSVGVETAPIPFVISKFFSWLRGGEVYATDLWKVDLSEFDLVYAFLSSEPMPKLWEKVRSEMTSGSVFVSNSFAVPDAEPSEVWELGDSRKTLLYIYRIE
ncbi:hypothetical protein QCB45_04295 [Thiomicrorhabdus sp. ZW0627]|uniref:hypothetical protein n=1 Tax=Thiomicrorhabdus sp. ZW0627 TaxID=3039774 RepID=UPI00243708CB|nr:hypothetical protein [Thiomicrorhabdus sp. ZW0627]MDG6773543.1 hypothetical protein [Thiomicrorhabdus sp. ZW0627]